MNSSAPIFFKTARIALVLTLLVILAGSVVRVTQSGMGCPDWPRCFGYYIPPTHEAEVRFHPGRHYKKGMMVIERDTLWRANTDFSAASEFNTADWEKYPKHDYAAFVVYQTWVEYINRLLGALLGLVILALVAFSFRFRKTKPMLMAYSFALLFLTGFQAWLGKLVVDGNLIPQSISIHMLAALVILWVLMLILSRKESDSPRIGNKLLSALALILVGLTTLQILIGTQVREEIDEIAEITGYLDRSSWIDSLSSIFTLHKLFSLTVAAVSIIIYTQRKQIPDAWFNKTASAIGYVLLAEVALGLLMAYGEVPRFAQSLHLLFSTILFCLAARIFLGTRAGVTSS
jgi:cytochrome c oxidase assembly protein subunit 15